MSGLIGQLWRHNHGETHFIYACHITNCNWMLSNVVFLISTPPPHEGLGQYVPIYHTTNFYPHSFRLWRCNTHSVPKRRLLNTLHRRKTQKITHDNVVLFTKVQNQWKCTRPTRPKQSHFMHYTPVYQSINKQHLLCKIATVILKSLALFRSAIIFALISSSFQRLKQSKTHLKHDFHKFSENYFNLARGLQY
jgi:hypothetical protein